MDSKLITSWVTIWGINDLSLGVSTNQSFKPLWTPPNSLSFSPSWMNRSSKAPNVLLQLLKTFGQMFQARSFKPQGLRGGVPVWGKVPVWEGRLEKTHGRAVQKSWTEGSKRSIFMQISGFFIGFLTCGGLSTQLCSTNFAVTNGFTF